MKVDAKYVLVGVLLGGCISCGSETVATIQGIDDAIDTIDALDSTDSDGDLPDENSQTGVDGNGDADGALTETADLVSVRDCMMQLPCVWRSSDGGFEVSFTNFDRSTIDRDGQLVAYLSVVSTRDTSVTLLDSGEAIDDTASNYTNYTRLLADSGIQQGDAGANLFAGVTVRGWSYFHEVPDTAATRLERFSLQVMEDGQPAETIVLTNVPLGPIVSDVKDCEDTLPCRFTAANGELVVDIVEVKLIKDFYNYLEYSVEVTTSRDMRLGRDRLINNFMIADTGQALEINGGIGLGGTGSYYDDAEYDALAGVSVSTGGRFLRPDTSIRGLQRLRMSLFEQPWLPRHDPQFTNVPVANEL